MRISKASVWGIGTDLIDVVEAKSGKNLNLSLDELMRSNGDNSKTF